MSTVLITGASRGIGKAAALAFAKAGWCVAINYRASKDEAERAAAEICAMGGHAAAFCADVSDYEACARLAQAVREKFGRIDALINNAGISCDRLFTDTTPDDWERTFAVNVTGAYNCTRAVLDEMISKKRGCIVNVSSMWGVTGGSCEVAYSASKAALIGFTKALAKELGPSNIRVNCVAPGVIDTSMNARLKPEDMAVLADAAPLCRIGTPDDVASALVFLASDAASFITGQVLGVDGGMAV